MCCAEVWGNTYATNIKCLVLLQEKVVRVLCGANRLDHTSKLFYNLCIIKVPDIMELRIRIIMFMIYHNLLPTYVQQFFSQPEFCNATRQNYTFTQTFARTNLKSMSLSSKGVQLWNSLDSSLFFVSECSSFQIIMTLTF